MLKKYIIYLRTKEHFTRSEGQTGAIAVSIYTAHNLTSLAIFFFFFFLKHYKTMR